MAELGGQLNDLLAEQTAGTTHEAENFAVFCLCQHVDHAAQQVMAPGRLTTAEDNPDALTARHMVTSAFDRLDVDDRRVDCPEKLAHVLHVLLWPYCRSAIRHLHRRQVHLGDSLRHPVGPGHAPLLELRAAVGGLGLEQEVLHLLGHRDVPEGPVWHPEFQLQDHRQVQRCRAICDVELHGPRHDIRVTGAKGLAHAFECLERLGVRPFQVDEGLLDHWLVIA
mmetsp:Transcript_59510/g.171834  ORF Transcript_59510/g.171834 Transcript_59510/m.171834 type:complete len:224 (+) Transcript_59510:131-802(+)